MRAKHAGTSEAGSKQRGLDVASVPQRPGRPTDSRQAFSPARPGPDETDLGFSGQGLGKPLLKD